MNVNGSVQYYNKSNAAINRQQSSAKLTLHESTGGNISRSISSDKDTFTLSGAKIHIDESIAGTNGVGDGSRYSNITSFLKKTLEGSLGTAVGEINIDDLEVDSRQITLKTKQANPTEYPVNDGVAYHMKDSQANVNLNEITVEGTVKTRDGKEMQFSLDIDTYSEAGSQKRVDLMANGNAVDNSSVPIFDGVYRNFSDTNLSFDSNQDTKGAANGCGSYYQKSEEHNTVGSGFRRFDRRA